ncbi:uncharacterized protein [Miscanthus floridulus]|uniref:uncharacterized protein n=1 Tax=Miscanthus floridulus TaxID=154761 RepID=UPI00345A38DC
MRGRRTEWFSTVEDLRARNKDVGLDLKRGKPLAWRSTQLKQRAFVEYKGVIPPDQIPVKKNELEREANMLISEGAKVLASVFPYEEAAILCGGSLPSYISKDSTPRIVKLGDNPGGPCGGTHVADISIINSLKVANIRVKKGLTKVSYSISP